MNVEDELIRIEMNKMLSERIKEHMVKIMDDFNEENNGFELNEIRMGSINYVMSVKDKEITL